MRVIGIDPSLRNSGYAVVENKDGQKKLLTFGSIKNSNRLSHEECLLEIFNRVFDLCNEFKPDEFAIESIIYVQSKKTAITMGSARAGAIIAAAKYGLKVTEYSPKKVKLAVVGNGNASKQQVSKMVTSLLGISDIKSFDASDALAVAFTHINNYDSKF